MGRDSDASSLGGLPEPPVLDDDIQVQIASVSNDDIGQRLSFGSESSKEGEEDMKEFDSHLVQVYLRIRPVQSEMPEEENYDTITPADDKTVKTKAPKESQSFKNRETEAEFSFSSVFDKPTTQEKLYQQTTESLVSTVLSGKDGLLFAYGVTNAGKTYTVEGSDENPGLIPRALEQVFSSLAQNGTLDSTSIRISYLQVYNEEIHDLQTGKGENLKIKIRGDNVEVEGLRRTRVKSCDDAIRILIRGKETRTTHETNCNVASSRSHSVFIVHVNSAKLYIVDLAGSERSTRTQTSKARQREASNINASLMNLMRCLDTMRLNQKYKKQNKKEKMIPFRVSKLTLLFRDCFVGANCGGVCMILCASPEPGDYDETIHALKYGAIVKSVKVERSVPSRASLVSGLYDANGRRIASSVNPPRTMSRLSHVLGSSKNIFSGKKKIQRHHSANETDEEGALEIQDHPDFILLQQELIGSRMQCVTLEAEIREEVAAEMAERLQEMEGLFRKRVDAAKQISDNKSDLLLRNLRKRMDQGGANIYTMEDIESLVQNINECEEEMERMRHLHAADNSFLNREVESLKKKLIDADVPYDRRNSGENAEFMRERRRSFETLDKLILEHLNTISRLEEELAEERGLHEMTSEQLDSSTKLAKDAQQGEADAERQLISLRLEIDQLKQRPNINPSPSRTLGGIRMTTKRSSDSKSHSFSEQSDENNKEATNNVILEQQPIKKGLVGRMVGRMRKNIK